MPSMRKPAATTRLRLGLAASGLLIVPLCARALSERIFSAPPLIAADAPGTATLCEGASPPRNWDEELDVRSLQPVPTRLESVPAAGPLSGLHPGRPVLSAGAQAYLANNLGLRPVDWLGQPPPCECPSPGEPDVLFDNPLGQGYGDPAGSLAPFGSDPSAWSRGAGLGSGGGSIAGSMFALGTLAAVASALAATQEGGPNSTTIRLGEAAQGSATPAPQPIVVSP